MTTPLNPADVTAVRCGACGTEPYLQRWRVGVDTGTGLALLECVECGERATLAIRDVRLGKGHAARWQDAIAYACGIIAGVAVRNGQPVDEERGPIGVLREIGRWIGGFSDIPPSESTFFHVRPDPGWDPAIRGAVRAGIVRWATRYPTTLTMSLADLEKDIMDEITTPQPEEKKTP